MSDELKAGDRVQWWDKRRKEQRTGEVLYIQDYAHYAHIKPDKGTSRYIDKQFLTRLNDSDIVAAVAARPLDDADRESAIAGLTDDYDEVMAMMRNANSLGPVEL